MLERETGKDGASKFNQRMAIALVVLLGGGALVILAQPFLPKGPELPPWEGPGPEPAARKWAIRLEPSLEGACTDAFRTQRDKRTAIATVSQQLGKTEPITRDEAQDVLNAILDQDTFVRGCVAQAYRAIEPCSPHAKDIGGPAMRSCVAKAMSRLVWAVPYDLCSERTHTDRIRRACAAAAEQARRYADQTSQAAKNP